MLMPSYNFETTGQQCQVRLEGDLTASQVPDLQAALKEQLAQFPQVNELVFDLAQTAMLDSSGIGLLIAASNSLGRRQGKVRVTNVSGDIIQLLQSMRLAARLNASGRPA